jgi:hypothetical protein
MKFIKILLFLKIAFCMQSVAQEKEEYNLSMIFIKDSFPTIELSDADAALKIFTDMYSQKLLDNSDIKINVSYDILNNYSEIEPTLNERFIDMINIPSTGYKELQLNSKYTPFVASDFSGNKFERYVLIVNSKSDIDSLDDLRNKKMVLRSNNLYDLTEKWLSVELFERGLVPAKEFFSNIRRQDKELKTINEIFF